MPALLLVLATVASGCATGPSPTPPAPVTPAPTVEPTAPVPPDEVPAAATPSPAATDLIGYGQSDGPLFPGVETSAQLAVDVSDLRDMAGLDLVVVLYPQVAFGSQLLRLPIDVSPYSVATKTVPVPDARLMLLAFAGQRPCRMGFMPRCKVSGGDDEPPDYGCRLQVEIEPGDDRSIAIAGLPKLPAGQGASNAYPTCPVAEGS
jgi:hypothetical protein